MTDDAPDDRTGDPPKPADAAVIGAGRPHDTETPDIETASDRYAARFAGALGEWLLDEQSAAITRMLARTGDRPLRVLDVGGGHGQIAPLLLAAGHDVTIHGSTPECFRRVEHLREAHPDRFRTAASSLWNLPFEDESFDLVLAVRLLGHTARWRELLAEMARVSRSFVLIEFARASFFRIPGAAEAIFVLKRRIEGTTRPFFSYSERRLREELSRHSFEATAMTAMFSLPMVVHRMVNDPALSATAETSLRRWESATGSGHPRSCSRVATGASLATAS